MNRRGSQAFLYPKDSQQTVQGTAKNSSYFVAGLDGGLGELVTIVEGDASDSLKGQVTAMIRLNIAGDKVGEVIDNKSLYGWVVEAAVNERRQGSEPAVRKGLTINAVNNLRECHLHLCLKIGLGLTT